MTCYSADDVWHLSNERLLELLESGIFLSGKRKVWFYSPSFTHHEKKQDSKKHFATISITGTKCALNCKHCARVLLKTMQQADSPERLFDLVVNLKRQGVTGVLLSGGCRQDGSVPLDKFIPAIKRLKTELDITVLAHTGIINKSTARKLKETGIDAALIDVMGSNNALTKICNLNTTTESFESSLKALEEADLSFVPHVIVGLENGVPEGELQALKMICRYNPSALVIIAFTPLPGTEMENVDPAPPEDIARVVATARLMFPKTPLALGCMRPKGKHRIATDLLALKAGVDAIAFPSYEAVCYAMKREFDVHFSPECCSQICVNLSLRNFSK